MIDFMSMNRWSVTFLVGIFILPYLILPNYFSPYEPIKVYFIIIWSVILAMLSKDRSGHNLSRPLIMGVLSLITLVWVSSIINGNLNSAIYGNIYRADGLIALCAMLLISLGFAQNWNSTHAKYLTLIARVNAIVIPILAFSFSQLAWLFGNPVIMTGYLVMLTPYILFTNNNSRWDLFWKIICLLFVTSTIIYVQAWGALLALLVVIALKKIRTNWKFIFAVFLAILIVGGAYYLENHNRGFTSESRQRILVKGIIAVWQRPIIGWGWSNFARAFTEIDYPEYYKIDAYVDRPHSSILDYGVAGGIPTLLMFLYVIFLSGKQLLNSSHDDKSLWLAVLILYLIHSQTNVTSITEDLFLWLTIGRATQIKQ